MFAIEECGSAVLLSSYPSLAELSFSYGNFLKKTFQDTVFRAHKGS